MTKSEARAEQPAGAQPGAQPGDPGARLLLKIGDFLEPLTRFDRSHLTMSESRHDIVPVLARQVFRVSFFTQERAGNGDLPPGVAAMADAAMLARESEAQLNASRAAAPARLAEWAEANGENARARLAVQDCFTALPPIGHVETCATCSGAGSIDCETCKGAGDVTCSTCKGQGAARCEACEATGAVTCQTCKGAGNIMEQKQRKVWDDVIDQERVEHFQEVAPCPVCNKSGSVICRRCSGAGETPCLTCEGKKRLPCKTCAASGKLSCGACGGTGKRYRIVELACSVTETFEAAPRAQDAETAAALKSQDSIESVLRLSTSHRSTAETNGHVFRRDTQAEVPVTCVLVSVSDHEKTVIRGFGPEQDVFDYRNLAGMLLVGDLVQLDSAIAMTSFVPPKVNEMIYESLSSVLASETNVAIAMEKPSRAPADIARGFRGVVTADYIKRAGTAVRTAISRAYWAQLAKGPVVALALPLLFLPLDLFARGSGLGARIGLLLAIMAATFGAAWIGHLWAVRVLQKRIAPVGEPRIADIIKPMGLANIWLIASGVAAVVLTLTIAGLTSWLLPVS